MRCGKFDKEAFVMNERRILIAPYEGNAPFIFVSYSHRNRDDALSIVERLQKDGYRVWYDEGIHPGSEWDEYIAQYVANCSLFLALLSEEYLLSSNCKDELNYARNKEKNRVLIYLKDIELPAGMELRLSRLQNIHRSSYIDENSFFDKLYTSSGIEECKETVEEIDSQCNYAIYNKSSQEEMRLENGSYIIGRNSRKCRIYVNDNKASLVHAILTVNKDAITIRDLNSTNRILINGNQVEANREYELHDTDVILVGETELVIVSKHNEYAMETIDEDTSCALEILSEHKELVRHNVEMAQSMHGPYSGIGESLSQHYNSRIEALQYAERIIESPESMKKTSPSKSRKRTDSKKAPVVKENVYYFGAKRVKKLYQMVPDILEVPEKTNIVLSNAFHNLVGNGTVNVRKIILSENVREIQKEAFKGLVIQETIVIPDSVVEIGEDAFRLSEDAYVVCSVGSKAFSYCSQYGLKNSVDIATWKKYGKCQHCGGDFSFFFKKCKMCGIGKDY